MQYDSVLREVQVDSAFCEKSFTCSSPYHAIFYCVRPRASDRGCGKKGSAPAAKQPRAAISVLMEMMIWNGPGGKRKQPDQPEKQEPDQPRP